jgi:hypothetical protein
MDMSTTTEPAMRIDGSDSVVEADLSRLSWDEQYKLISSTVIPRPIALVSLKPISAG